MSVPAGHRCQYCGSPAESGVPGGACGACRSEFAASLRRRRERWRALARRLRAGLWTEALLGVGFLAYFAVTVAYMAAATQDYASYRASWAPVVLFVSRRALLVLLALAGIWLDAHVWMLPRAPTVGPSGPLLRFGAVLAWTPGASLSLVCLLNFFVVEPGRGTASFLTIIVLVALFTAASASALARRIRDFDRFRAACTDTPVGVRLGPIGVWSAWLVVAVGCWFVAMYIRTMGPYYVGFDIRTVRVVVIASALVWFVQIAAVRRALRRWSNG